MEESLKNFINSIIFLVKLFSGLKDKFLGQKLYDKISEFISGYIRFFNPEERDSNKTMSHNIIVKDLKYTIDSLLELLDYLEHSKSVSVSPLLYARKNLLNLKLDLIKLHQKSVKTIPESKENKTTHFIPPKNKSSSFKENSNKERIFNFIKRSPNSRTKEIIEEFNILSERTVKRNLKELITEGIVRKFAKDNGVYYSAR